MVGRAEVDQARAVVGAVVSLLAFACIGAVLITDDLYSGRAEMGTEQDFGWWEADVHYGFMNGSVVVGDNDNLIGNPDYTEYVVNYTGSDQGTVLLSAGGFLVGFFLCLATFIFGLLTSFRKVSWVLPLMTGVAAFILVLVPLVILHNAIPDTVDSDLRFLEPYISESIPPEQMDNLTGNLSYGGSFFWGYLSIPFLVIAPLLMIGVKREKGPSRSRLAYNFFLEEERSRKRKRTSKPGEDVKGGTL